MSFNAGCSPASEARRSASKASRAQPISIKGSSIRFSLRDDLLLHHRGLSLDASLDAVGRFALITSQEALHRSALESDVQIARVDDLVEAVGDETCCCHAEKPAAQPSHLDRFRELFDWQSTDNGFPKALSELEAGLDSESTPSTRPIDQSWGTPSLRKWLAMEPRLS
jgi:hypothetical protein